MDPLERRLRKLVYDLFLENTSAPSAEEIATHMGLSVSEVRRTLVRLDEAHQLKLLEGTSRILMAFPFSAISTPYRVTRENGKRYFANCAWDSIAFHPMLGEPLRVDSFCDACAAPVEFRLEGGKAISTGAPLPRVRMKLPAADWWKDVTRTCANTMVFLDGREDHHPAGSTEHHPDPGVLTVDQVIEMSVPIYSGKLQPDYDRPPPSVIQSTFDRLGLTGTFWKL